MSNPSKTAPGGRKKVQAGRMVSNAELRTAAMMPVALARGWSAARLSEEVKVSPAVALRVMKEHKIRNIGQVSKIVDRRIEVARNAEEAALARLPRFQSLLDRAEKILENALPGSDGTPGNPVALDKFGEPIPIDPERIIKAMGGLVKAGKDLHSYMEQATGLDVVKAVSVRQQTQGSGPVTSWDGVGSLESSIEAEVAVLPLELDESQEDWI